MLSVRAELPPALLDFAAHELHRVLPGPTLFHLAGRRPEPLLVSVLLHGDEETGWDAVRSYLRAQQGRELPRALSLFIGNVKAAQLRRRYLPDQPDYNRIWTDLAATKDLPERAMTRAVFEQMRTRGVFASIDLHNNTGVNPHYACVRRLDDRFLHLATLFSRTVVYFTKPEGVQAEAFATLCPAVTVECGQAGQAHGVEHAADYLDACLHLAELPQYPVAPHDIDLYHSVAIVKVPADVSVGFGAQPADIRLVEDLDRLNFRELPVDTLLGHVRSGNGVGLQVWDEHGRDVAHRFLRLVENEIRTAVPVMPSMFTVNLRAIRADCLGYLTERPTPPAGAGSASESRTA